MHARWAYLSMVRDISIYPSIYLSIYLSVDLFIYNASSVGPTPNMPTCPSIYLSVCRSIYLSMVHARWACARWMYLSIHLSIYLFIHPPICCLSIYSARSVGVDAIYISNHPSIYPSIRLSVYLSLAHARWA